jgi:hypothetical protein
MAERERFSFSPYPQVIVKPALARRYPVFDRVTGESELCLQFPQFAVFPWQNGITGISGKGAEGARNTASQPMRRPESPLQSVFGTPFPLSSYKNGRFRSGLRTISRLSATGYVENLTSPTTACASAFPDVGLSLLTCITVYPHCARKEQVSPLVLKGMRQRVDSYPPGVGSVRVPASPRQQ